ncbi:MAG: diguanylate cyclase [Planctomycetes bacterium]|nr:diguanylate cyclase [Planctomycetota bacterium]
MDEDLRRLERAGAPLTYAAALRRAGQEAAARRVVEAAAREGRAGAFEALDAGWPLDPRVERVVAAALAEGRRDDREALDAGSPEAFDQVVAALAEGRRGHDITTAMAWLLGDEDPRVDAPLGRLVDALLATTGTPLEVHGEWREDERLIAAARGGGVERRRLVVERAGADLPLLCLARARLDADEAARLVARAERGTVHEWEFGHPNLLLTALWHAARAGAVEALARHRGSEDVLVAVEAGAPPPAPALLPGLPFRPVWAPDACPVETRDMLTGAFTRPAFVADPAAPFVSDAPREAPMRDWIMDVDVKDMRRLLDMFGVPSDQVLLDATRRLHACVGDRVARWSGDEWLVRLEPEVDARAVAEGIRKAVGDVPFDVGDGHRERVTVSIGIGRADTWAQAVIRASTAMALASQEGGDRVREAH